MRVFRQKGSRVYRVRYRLSNGPKTYDEPLHTHLKEVADAKARALVEEKERELAGLLDPKPLRDAAKRPIHEHLTEYVADLAGGTGKDHVVHARQRLKKVIAACGWQLLGEMSPDGLAKWLVTQGKLSLKTKNEYLGHFVAFSNWLIARDRLAQNPFAKLKRFDSRGRETFKRRALLLPEFLALLEKCGDRRLTYALAGFTGLRRGELRKLLWADVHLEVPCPFIEARAATTKNRLAAMIPLVTPLVELLKAVKGSSAGLVLPNGVPSAKTLVKDLTVAGIAVVDERGWRVDFHALRHTFVSFLENAEVPEGARMRLARHSTLKMTNNYTDPKSVPLFAGMEKLSLLLPSSIASLNFGKSSPNEGNVVQSEIPHEVVEEVDFRGETEFLGKAVPSWEILEMVPPRGIEPRFED